LDEYGIEVGKPANLIILPAENGYDALRRQVPVAYSIRAGKVIAKTTLPETEIFLPQVEQVTYKKM
jgi:cytosine deaminase